MKRMPVEAVMRMAFVGRYERMPAQRAYELGMISEVVDPPERLREAAQELAEKIAKNSPAGDGGDEARARGARWSTGSPRPAAPARRSWSRCGATRTRKKDRARSRRSATRSGNRSLVTDARSRSAPPSSRTSNRTRAKRAAFNAWYERDHFYAAAMAGPGMYAGARWVATRACKDVRLPGRLFGDPARGSYLATYWLLPGTQAEWDDWAARAYAATPPERLFAGREHLHTAVYAMRLGRARRQRAAARDRARPRLRRA